MDIFLIMGVIIGLLAVIVGMMVKGANIVVLLNPAAAIIILIGTMAAVMNSFPKNEFIKIPKILGVLFKEKGKEDQASIIIQIVELSKTSRKDGLLSLEKVVENMQNKFMKKGLSMVVDGTEAGYIREVLEMEIESIEERHRLGASIFTTAGGAAPTLGVLGAVVGLIGALGNLNDVEKLGHMIAGAFVATLYGIFFGYVVCHPFASRLKRKSHEEVSSMYIIVEGVLAIQEGVNPQKIQEKLIGMLEPSERIKIEGQNIRG
ncbi:flagellar motor stator protein MotA [Clostridium sporogenes]|uniref:Flagellar motor protein MotA n=2 Tax=Clostridium TaxID=1485 RepID=A0A6M0T253_CLOBO|nr:flagellar motor stator protein MotA [Clostridium sporogenes]NFA61839.1 flagellar motor protein MotA [Clostridium botulinum]MDS1003009.1 flagellar motor stator protein MotA [Clostridium sporogenes]NFI72665.1 flagellar motor stator protein MotA [Clostridium sporogenes]NFL72350.1 flagellar motor stator protein MotA [Clostridium sporogenes]NFM24702.1 flagellar motor stator protein MotA [Clostridium sporogenes]